MDILNLIKNEKLVTIATQFDDVLISEIMIPESKTEMAELELYVKTLTNFIDGLFDLTAEEKQQAESFAEGREVSANIVNGPYTNCEDVYAFMTFYMDGIPVNRAVVFNNAPSYLKDSIERKPVASRVPDYVSMVIEYPDVHDPEADLTKVVIW